MGKNSNYSKSNILPKFSKLFIPLSNKTNVNLPSLCHLQFEYIHELWNSTFLQQSYWNLLLTEILLLQHCRIHFRKSENNMVNIHMVYYSFSILNSFHETYCQFQWYDFSIPNITLFLISILRVWDGFIDLSSYTKWKDPCFKNNVRNLLILMISLPVIIINISKMSFSVNDEALGSFDCWIIVENISMFLKC